MQGEVDYTEGSIIEYAVSGKVRQLARVDSKVPDIKDGCPGFYGTTVLSGFPVQVRDDQVVRVVQ